MSYSIDHNSRSKLIHLTIWICDDKITRKFQCSHPFMKNSVNEALSMILSNGAPRCLLNEQDLGTPVIHDKPNFVSNI